MGDSLFDSLSSLLEDVNQGATDTRSNSEYFDDSINNYNYSSSFSDDDVVSDLDNIMTFNLFDPNKKVYIITEKQSFRSDSLYNILQSNYKTQMIYYNVDPKPILKDAMYCILDITNFELNSAIQEMLKIIQRQLIAQNSAFFVVGEQADIYNIDALLQKDEITIRTFARPINVEDLIMNIEATLTTVSVKGKKKHIFAVDDSLTFLRLVQKTLEQKYRVTITASAFECIRTLGTLDNPPDLIIIDYMMPTCDGLTLCKMIKDNDFTKDVPVIFYSGNNNVNEIIQLMPMIDGYILKSQPINTLDEYLESIFEKKKKEKQSIEKKSEKKEEIKY